MPVSIDTCAICRALLRDACIECQTKPEVIDAMRIPLGTIIVEAKELWMTMLLAAKRPPFNKLGIDIIQRIYSGALPEQPNITWDCPVIRTHCDHVYHECCIKKWMKKRQTCPLDNLPMTNEILDSFSCQISAISGRMEILQTYRTDMDDKFVSSSAKRARVSRAREFIQLWLKRTHPAKWSFLAISEMYNRNTQEKERISSLKEVVDELCNDKYIQEIEDSVYRHNP